MKRKKTKLDMVSRTTCLTCGYTSQPDDGEMEFNTVLWCLHCDKHNGPNLTHPPAGRLWYLHSGK